MGRSSLWVFFCLTGVSSGLILDELCVPDEYVLLPEIQNVQLNRSSCIYQSWEDCNTGKILYYLFSNENPNSPQQLNPYEPEPLSGMFDPTRPTYVVVHGYMGNLNSNITANMYEGLLAKGNSNVIVVDWGQLARFRCYPAAVFNTAQTGRCIGQLLVSLTQKYSEMNTSLIHAIGHSLGAHVAAFASNTVFDSTGNTIGRITGLDPALPLFDTMKNSRKLDASDAHFVDIIHTNAGILGQIEPMGHVDFYVNGGTVQPASIDKPNVPVCSHIMATVYFAESVTSTEGFWGYPCESTVYYILGLCKHTETTKDERALMGLYCDPSTRGVYFVETSSTPPYALGLQ